MRKKVQITTISNHETNTYETRAIITDSSIIYIENDSKQTKVNFNYEKNELTRQNIELSMKYSFAKNKTTIGNLMIYELNKNLKVNITTELLVRSKYNIRIKFTVENEPVEYIIEVIE